jgi:hypothetical protein
MPAWQVAPAFARVEGRWGKGWSLRLRQGCAIGAKAGAFAYKDFDEDDDQHEDEMGGLAKIYGACSCPSGE